MFPTLTLGPFTLPVPGLLQILAVWLTLELAGRQAARLGLQPLYVYNTGLIGLVAGVAGARLAFVLQHLDAYSAAPLEIILPNLPGSFAVVPGVVIGLLAVALYVRVRGIAWRDLADAYAVAAPALVAVLALADLAGGTAYGMPTDLPWAIPLWGANRHPTQVYELIAALFIGAIVVRDKRPYAGHTALLFVALYGVARTGIEGLRGDSWLLPGGWRGAQVLALAAATVALVLMGRAAAGSRLPGRSAEPHG
jgi:phosphatidylglycerol:prolipoprotein diacylglycerol transferase